MNKKIKLLAEQADWRFSDKITGDELQPILDKRLEKFAELIVRECLMICKSHKIQSTDDVWYLAHNETVDNISENIEEYFGVEESDYDDDSSKETKPFTPEEVDYLRKWALEGDLKNAKILLEQAGYKVQGPNK